jgi:hypothetical protein
MIVERDASEEEMILQFLKAECGRPLIDDADLSDQEQNVRRAQMLDERRGYTSRSLLFANFPRDVHWKYSKLTKEDFERVRYVNSSPWRPLAGSELRVIDGARRIAEESPTIPEGVHVQKIRNIVRSIREGRDVDAALILADVGDGRLVLMEGNNRAIAFVIASIDRPIAALLGSSPEMASWANQSWR